MKRTLIAGLFVVMSVPSAFAGEDKFPIRSQLAAMGGGEMPAVAAVEQGKPAHQDFACTMDVDYKMIRHGWTLFRVKATYEATAKVDCFEGGKASYSIKGEGMCLGLSLQDGLPNNDVLAGKTGAISLRIPHFSFKKLEGWYTQAGVQTTIGGLAPFISDGGQFGGNLMLPTGIKDGNLFITLNGLRVYMKLLETVPAAK